MNVKRHLKGKLAQNIIALYGVQFSKYVLPLLTIPYLTRVLGVENWGLLAIAQSYASYIGTLVEYGFNLAGTREVARHPDDAEKLTELLAGVWGAEAILVTLGLAVTAVMQHAVPAFKDNPLLLWMGVYWSLTQAITPIWYFSGLERLKFVAALDFASKLLYTLCVFVFIRAPEDAWKVLGIQGTVSLFSTILIIVIIYREIPFRWPTLGLARKALVTGWTMFIFLSSSSLYTTANAFILGLFVVPEFVAYYVGAEKLGKVFLMMLEPITRALYPRLSNLVHSSREKAARLAKWGVTTMGLVSSAAGIGVFISAPLLVKVVLGEGFEPTIPALRVMSVLIPTIALSNFLGIQWMLPLGLDRIFNAIIISAGGVSLLLAFTLAPIYGYMAMAWISVVAEVVVTTSMYLVLRLKQLDPFTYVDRFEETTNEI